MTNTDLISRLRALSRCEHDDLSIGDEAADEIERLTAALAVEKADAEDAWATAEATLKRDQGRIHKLEAALAAEKERADGAGAMTSARERADMLMDALPKHPAFPLVSWRHSDSGLRFRDAIEAAMRDLLSRNLSDNPAGRNDHPGHR